LRRSRRFLIYVLIFLLLAAANSGVFIFALGANIAKDEAYKERLTLNSAVYDLSLSSTALTRWMRFYVITGSVQHYQLYFNELARNQVTHTLQAFIDHDAHSQEVTFLRDIQERKNEFDVQSTNVFSLRQRGYYQEAIDLAHSQVFWQWGSPFSDDIQTLLSMTEMRTEQMISEAEARLETAQMFVFLTLILLTIVATFGFYEAYKLKLIKPILYVSIAFAILAGFSVFFAVRAIQISGNKGDALDLQHNVFKAIYEAEQSTGELGRLSRHHIVTGGQTPLNLYYDELELARFEQALHTLITLRVPDEQINTFVELIGRTSALRQIEEEAIILRIDGYVQEAIDMVYSEVYAGHGIPISGIARGLRDMSFLYTSEIIDNISDAYIFRRTLQIITTAMLVATGILGFWVLHRRSKAIENGKGGCANA